MKIIVKNNDVSKAYKLLNRKLHDEGVLKESEIDEHLYQKVKLLEKMLKQELCVGRKNEKNLKNSL